MLKRERMREAAKRKKDKQEIDSFMKTRKKYCRFCKDKVMDIDYKNLNILERMISDRGRILSRRVTGNCSGHQRKVCAAIKRARYLSIIPYTK